MIFGAHALVYSRTPVEARAFLEKILTTDKVDAGGGWLIFALPPAEIAVHPTDGTPGLELYLMCQDLEKTIGELREKGVKFTRPVQEASWGRMTAFAIPGGGELGLYAPRHRTPLARPSAASKGGARRGRPASRPASAKQHSARSAVAVKSNGSGRR